MSNHNENLDTVLLFLRTLRNATEQALKEHTPPPFTGYGPAPCTAAGDVHANEIDNEPGISPDLRRHLRVERRDALRGRDVDALRAFASRLSGDIGAMVARTRKRFKELEVECDGAKTKSGIDIATWYETAFNAIVEEYGFDKHVPAPPAPSRLESFVQGAKYALQNPDIRAQLNNALVQLGFGVRLDAAPEPAPTTSASASSSSGPAAAAGWADDGSEYAGIPSDVLLSAFIASMRDPKRRDSVNDMFKAIGLQIVALTPPPASPSAADPAAAPKTAPRRKA